MGGFLCSTKRSLINAAQPYSRGGGSQAQRDDDAVNTIQCIQAHDIVQTRDGPQRFALHPSAVISR